MIARAVVTPITPLASHPVKEDALIVAANRARTVFYAICLRNSDFWAGVSPRNTAASSVKFEELTPDAARTRTMVLVTHQLPDEASPRPTVTVSYQDIWRRTDAGWRIVRRSA